MKTVAIIAEYNPFHNGHAYQLEMAKKLTGADYAISVMGGNFLQRGQSAMWDKYTRAHIACENGIDAVFELSLPYATGSAGDFAYGAVCLLNQICNVDFLCFGAETDDIGLLSDVASVICSEPDAYKKILKDRLAKGDSYPLARQKALCTYKNDVCLDAILTAPNNILAMEYICALIKTGSHIKPVAVKRNTNYHALDATGQLASASAIRHILCSGDFDFSKIENFVSNCTLDRMKQHYHKDSPQDIADITPWLQQRLISSDYSADICDMSAELFNRLKKLSPYLSYTEIIDMLKTKNTTASRISRVLTHLLFNYTSSDRTAFFENGVVFYANLLALNGSTSKIVKYISGESQIPIITKKADFRSTIKQLSPEKQAVASRMWQLDTMATDFYNAMIFNRYGEKKQNDYLTGPAVTMKHTLPEDNHGKISSLQ
ncbi:MAG: nucleotidyltransferase family protein [Clostridium sp.]|nr:nucleotidyltransferase family protein [Clostridium sp.]MCM1400198.1 nucleotidyltransferase family protein [Clostridium sp.]MCM1460933.1 nucleotidyltransferase family protein [Bacteroides sp.]